jgi:hypothetical protein
MLSTACLVVLAVAAMISPGNAADVSAGESGSPETGSSWSESTVTDTYTVLEDEYLSVRPSVPEYTIEPDLSNVVNLDVFDEELTSEQVAMIASNGFVVSPSDNKQIFWIYERNDYTDPKIPSFITVDSMLHTYHFFFDYALREVESNKLIPVLSELTEAMLRASEEDLAATTNADLHDAALRNVAYFAVARCLLDGTPPPETVEDIVLADLERIEAHEGRDTSAIFDPLLIDFSQFIPRGHYTRSEELEKYFKAMMWYGLIGFPIPGDDIGPVYTRQALMIVRNLQRASVDGGSAMEAWETIYEPTAFFVGVSDDLSIYDYSHLMDEIYGESPQVDDFADESMLLDFVSRVKSLPGPGIEQYVPLTEGQEDSEELTAGWRQFRFMGQRFIPDSRVLQELVLPKVQDRLFPTGLDVLAALGSDRALVHLRDYHDVDSFQGYDSQMEKMRNEIDETSREIWQSNLYYGWLWSLQSIIEPAPEGYPSFMRNDAWLDKSLFTALGSWTELRHDTVLYAKQSGAECGDGYGEAPPKGYVEPNVEFWTRIQWLMESTRDGLAGRGLTDGMLSDRFDWLADLISLCRTVAIKELTNQEATDGEYRRLQHYGGFLEGLMLSCAGGDLLSEADKDMAVVVDVHTAFDAVLQEATGRVGVIYVVVPIQGELYLTRGGVFTQYEFTHPACDRLTDEKWREMLDDGLLPPFAQWTDSFFVETQTPLSYRHWDSGC